MSDDDKPSEEMMSEEPSEQGVLEAFTDEAQLGHEAHEVHEGVTHVYIGENSKCKDLRGECDWLAQTPRRLVLTKQSGQVLGRVCIARAGIWTRSCDLLWPMEH